MPVDDPQPDERRLVTRMLAGDEEAFRAFYDVYFPRIYRFALPRLRGSVEATREVVQATLAKAMSSLAKYRGEAALFSWLCQICRHEVVDHLRVHKRHSLRIVSIYDSPALQTAVEATEAPVTDDPAHRYSRTETRHMIQTVLDGLPANYGDVLHWKYIEGRSVEEIATLLGSGRTAAQSLLARARHAFREGLVAVFGSEVEGLLASVLRGE